MSVMHTQSVWHPFTQHLNAPDPLYIDRGEGSYLWTKDGRRLLDLISSWWVNLHGHCHPAISEAVAAQARKLDHVLFAGCTHEPADTFARELYQLLPPELCKTFFSDNGSTAVEVALKMAFQYWYNQGEVRPRFIALQGAYHGDTFGSMSVGQTSGYFMPFTRLLPQVTFLPFPDACDDYDAQEETLAQFRTYLQHYGQETAALILEPLIQGASGMRTCRPGFVRSLCKAAAEAGIPVIFDEVMTGFGRTGTMFAFEQCGIVPDFVCLSKGITGGILPLAVTLTKQHIYDAFLGTGGKAFTHGHSYTAHPLGCAAAVASLQIFTNEPVTKRIKDIAAVHKERIHGIPGAHRPRTLGTMAAFTLADVTPYKEKFIEAGLLLRPLGNHVYLLPPYSVTAAQLHEAYDIITDILTA